MTLVYVHVHNRVCVCEQLVIWCAGLGALQSWSVVDSLADSCQ